jgi:hypothetical protein
MLVAGHAVSLIAAIQMDKPVQMAVKKATAVRFSNLYVKEKYFVNLYCWPQIREDKASGKVRR